MKKFHFALIASVGLFVSLSAQTRPSAVAVEHKAAERRVDITIDGKPFTSYLYPLALQKPVLFPIRSAGGVAVTRGYPLEPKAGERADHPHHVGHWFNHGDVNGFDFWGHSDETPAANKPRMGVIVHKEVVKASGGSTGELVIRADWNIPDGSTLMREDTRFEFSGGPGRRVIDRTTTWTATGKPVTFKDTKEGAFGIRVARALDHVSKAPEVLVGPGGKGTDKRVETNGITGRYIGSDGRTGEDVWGTRGPWMGLTGVVEGQPVTLAIFDAPANHGHPTYWHARGYGLFAANPLGRQGYDPKQEPTSFTLQPGQAVTFHHRILVRDGQLDAAQLKKEYDAFAAARRPGSTQSKGDSR